MNKVYQFIQLGTLLAWQIFLHLYCQSNCIVSAYNYNEKRAKQEKQNIVTDN